MDWLRLVGTAGVSSVYKDLTGAGGVVYASLTFEVCDTYIPLDGFPLLELEFDSGAAIEIGWNGPAAGGAGRWRGGAQSHQFNLSGSLPALDSVGTHTVDIQVNPATGVLKYRVDGNEQDVSGSIDLLADAGIPTDAVLARVTVAQVGPVAGLVIWASEVTVGASAYGSTDLFTDDFSSHDLSNWDAQSGDAQVVTDVTCHYLFADGHLGEASISSPSGQPWGSTVTAGVFEIDLEVCASALVTYMSDDLGSLSGLLGSFWQLQWQDGPGTATILANTPASVPVTVVGGTNDAIRIGNTVWFVAPGTYTTVDDLVAALSDAIRYDSVQLNTVVTVANDSGSIRLTEIGDGLALAEVSAVETYVADNPASVPKTITTNVNDQFKSGGALTWVIPAGTYTTADDLAGAVANAMFSGLRFGDYFEVYNISGTIRWTLKNASAANFTNGTHNGFDDIGFTTSPRGSNATNFLAEAGFDDGQQFSGTSGAYDYFYWDAVSGYWTSILLGQLTDIPALTPGPHKMALKFDFDMGTWIYRYDGVEYDHSTDFAALDYPSSTLQYVLVGIQGVPSTRNRVFYSKVLLGTGDYDSDDLISEDFSGSLDTIWGAVETDVATIVDYVTCPVGIVAYTDPSVSGEDTTQVTVYGQVNPDIAFSGYTAGFEYGLTTGYGSATDPVLLTTTLDTTAIQALLTDLEPNNTYHYRVVLYDLDGSHLADGDDETFTTNAYLYANGETIDQAIVKNTLPPFYFSSDTSAFSPATIVRSLGSVDELAVEVDLWVCSDFLALTGTAEIFDVVMDGPLAGTIHVYYSVDTGEWTVDAAPGADLSALPALTPGANTLKLHLRISDLTGSFTVDDVSASLSAEFQSSRSNATLSGSMFTDISAGIDVPSYQLYYTRIQAGRAPGGSDIFLERFLTGDLSAWTVTTAGATVVTTPTCPPDLPLELFVHLEFHVCAAALSAHAALGDFLELRFTDGVDTFTEGLFYNPLSHKWFSRFLNAELPGAPALTAGDHTIDAVMAVTENTLVYKFDGGDPIDMSAGFGPYGAGGVTQVIVGQGNVVPVAGDRVWFTLVTIGTNDWETTEILSDDFGRGLGLWDEIDDATIVSEIDCGSVSSAYYFADGSAGDAYITHTVDSPTSVIYAHAEFYVYESALPVDLGALIRVEGSD